MGKVLFLIFSILSFSVFGQKYSVEKSTVTFFSEATVEDITAETKGARGILDTETGEIAFSILIREFKFAKSLMQEHFNEKYLESEKFPKSTFQGKIEGYSMTVSGPQPATASGKLTLHGVTKEINVPGTVEVGQDQVVMRSKFVVKLEDYAVKIPKLLWQNIAEQVEVSVDFTFKPYEKK
jgi:hypothetical protein